MSKQLASVRPELVEGPFFFPAVRKEGRGFDKLSPNGVELVRNLEVPA